MKIIGKSRDFATNERGAFSGFRGESRAICLAHYASVHHPTSPTALKKSCRSFDGAFDVLKCVDGSIAIYCCDCDDCDSETNNTSGGRRAKMKIEIKSTSGEVLFSTDAETLRDAVIAAVEDGADLSHANLCRADLPGANLRDANLSSANLRDANLFNADLSYADLRGADLSHANLCRADLFGVDLRDADLFGVDLRGANIKGTDLSDAKNISAN
jgi:uncharacterized protein YjbI with pentapeptide repeats